MIDQDFELEAMKQYARRHYTNALRLEVFTHYCGGKPHCMCPGCETTFIGFLQLDHIDGKAKKGYEHRGSSLLNWIKRNGYPEGFQVLCANCNSAKRQDEDCPMAYQWH